MQAIAACLRSRPDIHYAVIGGACLVALGSVRSTLDVDVVIAPPSLLCDARASFRTDIHIILSKLRVNSFWQTDGSA